LEAFESIIHKEATIVSVSDIICLTAMSSIYRRKFFEKREIFDRLVECMKTPSLLTASFLLSI
jgi:hypothetical protein